MDIRVKTKQKARTRDIFKLRAKPNERKDILSLTFALASLSTQRLTSSFMSKWLQPDLENEEFSKSRSLVNPVTQLKTQAKVKFPKISHTKTEEKSQNTDSDLCFELS